MELKHVEAIYIGVAMVVVMLIVNIIGLRKNENFKKGNKIVVPQYVTDAAYYKRKLFLFGLYKFFVVFFCIISILAGSVLIARPYTVETIEHSKINRDIILCMDVSESVNPLNHEIVSSMKSMVQSMHGERFGIEIFNTSGVLVCPLTDDYEYVLYMLDELDKAIGVHNAIYVESDETEDDTDSEGLSDEAMNEMIENNYYYSLLSSGTLVGLDMRGSSLIGDGLATAAFDFLDDDNDEEAEKSRVIIFSSDNELGPQSYPYFTLSEAAELCKSKGIKVYGIGTNQMYSNDRDDMEKAMLRTGGQFYIQSDEGAVDGIIKDIQKTVKQNDRTEKVVRENDQPQWPFIILLAAAALMMVFNRLAKL